MNLSKMLAALMVATMSLTLAPMATANHNPTYTETCPTSEGSMSQNGSAYRRVDEELTPTNLKDVWDVEDLDAGLWSLQTLAVLLVDGQPEAPITVNVRVLEREQVPAGHTEAPKCRALSLTPEGAFLAGTETQADTFAYFFEVSLPSGVIPSGALVVYDIDITPEA